MPMTLPSSLPESLRSERERSPAERKLALINLAAIIIPFAGFIAAMALLGGGAFDWNYLLIMAGMGAVSSFGITVGYHRLCTHKSFKTFGWLRYLFAAAGSMAVQGPVIRWCAEHRRHHQHSDTMLDPHSPHMGADGSWGEGVLAVARGAYHAQFGWLLGRRSRGLGKYSRDLRNDPALSLADRQFPLWVAAGLIIPALLGAALAQSWMGLLLGFLWGGLVRIFLVHHITWSVNSVCHLWGSQPFDCRDESRNNAIVGILALGEGWHNNHHAFPHSARHGLAWWQLDVSYVLIRALKALHLARDIRLPDSDRVIRKRRLAAAALPAPMTDMDGGVPQLEGPAQRVRGMSQTTQTCGARSDA